MSQSSTLFGALRTLADEIGSEKTAAANGNGREKRADGPTPADPGGYQGPSTHPTTGVDNRVQDANEGARSSENKADVKEDQGAPGVDSTSEATPGQDEQDSVQLNIGTQQSATGEDPSVEDDYKGSKDDPGTSHPAQTEDGEKYGSVSFEAGKSISDRLANEILADLANGYGNRLAKRADHGTTEETDASSASSDKEKEASAPTSATIAKAAAALKDRHSVEDEMLAGYELATALGIEKNAAFNGVADCIDETIQDALTDADLFGSYATPHFQKRAMPETGDPEGGEDHSAPGDAASGGGDGGDPLAGGGGGDGGGSIGDMLGGGADPGGLGGGDPMAGGGDPMAGGGEEASQEEALMQLVSALEELGIPLEDLLGGGGGDPGMDPGMGGGMEGALAGGGGDPGMGAPPPEAGGMPPEAGGMPPMGEGMKLASAAKAFRRSGKYHYKLAADGTRARKLRDLMKNHVLEVMNS